MADMAGMTSAQRIAMMNAKKVADPKGDAACCAHMADMHGTDAKSAGPDPKAKHDAMHANASGVAGNHIHAK